MHKLITATLIENVVDYLSVYREDSHCKQIAQLMSEPCDMEEELPQNLARKNKLLKQIMKSASCSST